MPRGGKRPGAGRKPKDRTPQGVYETAQQYLEAVVRGSIPADPARIAAARVLIQYENAKTRVPVQSPRPTTLQHKEMLADEEAQRAAFAQKAAKIRAKHTKEQTK